MRKPRRAKDERQAERNQIERPPAIGHRRAEFQPRFKEVLRHLLALDVVGDVRNRFEELRETESEVAHHEHAKQEASGHEQNRFDDLHPRRGEHSAKNHVDDHQNADADHRRH